VAAPAPDALASSSLHRWVENVVLNWYSFFGCIQVQPSHVFVLALAAVFFPTMISRVGVW
jgi:hypothetical protein